MRWSRSVGQRPTKLDPHGVKLSQCYLKVPGGFEQRKLTLIAGRQEIMRNGGRFVSTAAWRQFRENFDAVKWNTDPRQLQSAMQLLW